ncbi:phosphate ABC transporter permease subunit PstC [Sulfurovum mangrovi]|uniref:phosphate ABC transporter permease subunit PstC n=1 Tax=Sulfurovum mangrovi TaxID=2893889 RepID=UPI001E4DAF78|nr:phosphate ABC transporter permease subunit PstC [Sulfurovum mangrovi]UFH59108.1 phosphate ABC transporter permease subunit PstC [Sulfurovum mangrovi]
MGGKLFKNFSFLSATLSFFILVGIFAVLFSYAQEALHEFGIDFLYGETWEVDEDDEGGIFGGGIPIVGTLLSTLIAMVIAIPLAMGIAIFLTEIAHDKLVKPVSIAIELLAAIPSIIYGMWGLFYFAPIVQSTMGGNGVGLLTAGIVLAIMIIPFMAAITRDAMNTVPPVLKESAYAMGATTFEVVKDVVMPYAKGGIIGSIILALGRALGETMAVAFLIGSVMSIPSRITDPTTSIPVLLANNFAEAQDLEISAMYYLALILFVVSFALISLAKFYFFRKTV